MMTYAFPILCVCVLIIFLVTIFYIWLSPHIIFSYAYSEIRNTTEAQGTCEELARQYLVLADLRIIQAIQYMLENNITGVSDQLLTADKLLSQANEAIWCH
jgi:hypothetical protein